MSVEDMREAALSYADLGWAVLPLWPVSGGHCDCGKADCRSPGKHPHGRYAPHGLKDATKEADVIRDWFADGHVINIGILTGSESGIIVLDVDPRHGGEESLKKLGPMPETVTVATGGGGRHLYFRYPNGLDIRNSAKKLGPGLDIRGTGGYVVAPPSGHVSGNSYAWRRDPNAALAEMPKLLLDRLEQKKKVRRKVPHPSKETIPDGERNDALTSLAGKLRREGKTPEEMYARLREENIARCMPPLLDEEVKRIAESVSRYEPAPMRINLTDAGNGARFAAQHGNKVRYCWDQEKWFFYDGKRWNSVVGAEKVNQLAVATARSIVQEAEELDHDERGKYLKWSHQSESVMRLTAMLRAAQSVPPVAAYAKDFDSDPWLLNCLNGTVDLRTGELRAHDPDDLITKLCPVEYDPDAKLDLWDEHLTKVTGGDQELGQFIQTAVGYSITGDTREEKLFLVCGPTAGGKTTTIEAIRAVLGDYSRRVDFESFLWRPNGGGIRNDIACLAGSRFVFSVEVDEGRKLAEGLLKQLTGGDQITARFLYQEYFEFKPSFKLWLVANDAPRATDTDDALWRRIVVVPFGHTIPVEERDPKVKASLCDPNLAGPAILAWMVQGCRRWQQEGLRVPKTVKEATEQYREDQDPLEEFLEEDCIFDELAYVAVTELRNAYVEWAKHQGVQHPLVLREFNKRFARKGCVRKTKKVKESSYGSAIAKKCWVGVTLKARPQHDEPEGTPGAAAQDSDLSGL